MPPPSPEVVDLPGGRRLVVRPTTGADADALGALYDGLTDVDLCLRFFSVSHPQPEFLAEWARLGERGGIGLVAEVDDPAAAGSHRIVAEAGCVPDRQGEAELALCVDPRWRGWLGPYLLDALLRAAAERGIDHVRADVLWQNSPMVALARARGAEVVTQPDPSEVRLRIPTEPRARPVPRRRTPPGASPPPTPSRPPRGSRADGVRSDGGRP